MQKQRYINYTSAADLKDRLTSNKIFLGSVFLAYKINMIIRIKRVNLTDVVKWLIYCNLSQLFFIGDTTCKNKQHIHQQNSMNKFTVREG